MHAGTLLFATAKFNGGACHTFAGCMCIEVYGWGHQLQMTSWGRLASSRDLPDFRCYFMLVQSDYGAVATVLDGQCIADSSDLLATQGYQPLWPVSHPRMA